MADAHPEVLGPDLAPGIARRLLDVEPGGSGLGGGQLSAQPPIGDSPDAVERLGSAAAQPHLERSLKRTRRWCQVVECPAVGVMVDGLARPPGPEQAEHLLEHVATGRAVEPERVALSWLVEAGDGAEQQSAVGELIELSQLLGQQEWVPAEGDQVGAKMQPLGPSGSGREPEQQVEHRGDWEVR